MWISRKDQSQKGKEAKCSESEILMNEVERRDLKPARIECDTDNRNYRGVDCTWYKVTTAVLSRTHTHSYADRQAQKYTHLATNEVGQATRVSMDEGNSVRERQRHTQSSVEPGKISPVPKK